MYYIYAYIDPRNNQPFYIGKGTRNRKFGHLKEHDGKTDNRDKLAIIQELVSLNLSPLIIELESNIENEALAYNREDYYILTYGRQGFEPNGILTNKTIGGKHPPVPVWDDTKKKQHSEFNKTYWTPERRKAHGLKTKGNNGGKVTKGTVNVMNLKGQAFRILKTTYDLMDRSGDINTWEYVSVSSKEAKRRKQQNTP
jgi:hypothetical protein